MLQIFRSRDSDGGQAAEVPTQWQCTARSCVAAQGEEALTLVRAEQKCKRRAHSRRSKEHIRVSATQRSGR